MKKYLVPMGFAMAALVAAAVITTTQMPAARKSEKTTSREAVVGNKPGNSPKSAPSAQESPSVPTTVVSIAPLPANATFVPDESLLRLSGMVNLANARYQHPDKGRWNAAISVAQNLLAGPCDCAQRNWLNHFVEMGNQALADSNEQYQESAKLMSGLGRNDAQAMAISHRMN